MTNPNLTSINVVIDESGSMFSLQGDTIGGFNSFLEDQKKLPGKATVTVTKFNTRPTILYNSIPLEEAPMLSEETYSPTGGTALLDALGQTVDALGAKLKEMREEDRPGKVVFVIITDGAENASREYKLDSIKKKIEHQTDKYNWEFAFIGANIDAFAAGESIGIRGSNSVRYSATSKGVGSAYNAVSAGIGAMRANADYKGGDLFGMTLNASSVAQHTGGTILVNADGSINEAAKTQNGTITTNVQQTVIPVTKP